ncbi:hypothetical protein PV328_010064 [Microctonus aethiopoides]|uniref:Amine oxidase domain-containing protein n=1 Tax=Microctonus aethiopoides TaxID=144406 RepID=A0AA39C740_9HYME|nr:hypothetical protein PV328_010064 [Microctonus aethiopoides]
MRYFLVLICCSTWALSTANDDLTSTPRIIIVGAGSSGIAAASKLFENGFTNVKVLEAENRIGGRIHSDYLVDMGAQWVDGEKDNVAFELAWPLGLIERFNENNNFTIEYCGSSRSPLSEKILEGLNDIQATLDDFHNIDLSNLKSGSLGEFIDAKFNENFKNEPEMNASLQKSLLNMLNLMKMASDGANSWYDLSAKKLRDYPDCEGDSVINWKNRTYSTILDVLMKKIPNPEDELPVLNNTNTNSKVIKINYNGDSAPVKISTADEKEYLADHVIFTSSLGVLKANHEQLFDPPLPEKKISTIKNLGFGHSAKIWLYYDNPWWYSDENKQINGKVLFWTEDDRKKIENIPEKKWILGIAGFFPVEHRPKTLCIWMASNHSIEMESIPEDMMRNEIVELMNKFFGHEYNITEPTEIKRTLWNTNENFRGIYSYHGLQTDATNINNADLAEPIMQNDKPILQFAGEATSEHYGTVNGAIESGWREANRLINLYANKTLLKN